jgi:prophage DNA circulation protein
MVDFPFATVAASFRNVTFQIENERMQGGRRGPDHQYPFRDVPFAEDTGRKQRRLPLIGFLIGDDVGPQAAALVAACEKQGPGPLVHPWLGTLQVVCRNFETEDVWDRQRVITFRMEFAEAGQVQYPSTAADTQAATNAAADNAEAGITSDYVDDTASVMASLG